MSTKCNYLTRLVCLPLILAALFWMTPQLAIAQEGSTFDISKITEPRDANTPAPPAPLNNVLANLVTNGGFETGLTGWTVFQQGFGGWFSQTGTGSPQNGFPVPAPPEGSFAAMTDQIGPGLHILYQDITLTGDAHLSFKLYAKNQAGVWIIGPALSLAFVNQYMRVDIMDPTAPVTDIGAGVLQNIFLTSPNDPFEFGYILVEADLLGFGGSTVRLRFVGIETEFFFAMGVDDVVVTSGGTSADLAVTKNVNDLTPGYGETITYTVTVSNNGPDTADNVEISDALPAGLTFVSASASQGGYNAGTDVWDVGTLNDGDSATLTVNATVNTLDPATNTAAVSNSSASDPDPSNNSASVTVTPQAADLALDKIVDNAAPAIGDEVTFTVTITHLDGADVASARISDQLPPGTSYVSHTTTQGSYNAGNGIWQVGALTEGQTETLMITVEITSTAPITNTAFIAFSNQFDPVTGNNTDAASLNAVAADLEVSKKATGFSSEDGVRTATFEVSVSNEGPSATGGVVVTDNLSPDMTVLNITRSQGVPVLTASVITWTVGTLAVGATATMTVQVRVPQGGSLLNTAEVTAADLPDPDSEPGDGEGDDFAATTAGPRAVPDFVPGGGPGGLIDRGDRFTADLALMKDVNVDGTSATYTVMVENLGPQSTARVEVTDHLPDCLSYVSSSADRGAYDPDTWTWTIGKLKVGEKVTLEIVTTIGASCEGEVTNTASISSSSLPDPTDAFNLFDQPALANNSDEATFTASTGGRILDGSRFALGTNYPNPFNPSTLIPFSLAEASEVSIKVYDLLGRVVATLVEGSLSAGVHEVVFEAGHLPTGMYLLRMEAGRIVQMQRITLMK